MSVWEEKKTLHLFVIYINHRLCSASSSECQIQLVDFFSLSIVQKIQYEKLSILIRALASIIMLHSGEQGSAGAQRAAHSAQR